MPSITDWCKVCGMETRYEITISFNDTDEHAHLIRDAIVNLVDTLNSTAIDSFGTLVPSLEASYERTTTDKTTYGAF